MTIDKGKLIALLVEQTDWDQEEVAQQLDELIERIKRVSADGESFEIEGFGTFRQYEGDLGFEPASQLEIEINQKYVGMKPIELMAAFKKSGAGVPVEKIIPAETPKTAKEETKEQKETPSEQEKAKTKEEAKVPASAEKEAKPKKGTVKKTRAQEKITKKTQKEEKDPLGTILVAAVCLIVILIGGWFLYNQGVFGAETAGGTSDVADQASSKVVNEQTVQPQQNSQADTTTLASGSASSAKSDIGNANAAAYGLEGPVNTTLDSGYTIVIHSFRQEATVRKIKQNLAKEGYRVLLQTAQVDGVTYWRVGLGQFKTMEEADKVARELPKPYKSNYFIKHI